jgi:septal ring factor EnvC (AmiA/AmiB activator)
MSETDNSTEPPHVSGEELRAALTPKGETRRNPVLVSEKDDGEIKQLKEALATADGLRSELDASRRMIDSARADAIELRASLEAAREDAKELRLELTRARAESHERREALSKLLNAGLFRRRKVIAELKARNAF